MAKIRIDQELVARDLSVPGVSDDKYSRGVALLATGSPTYPGAGVLGALGAAFSGVGMVRFVGAEPAQRLVLERLPEVVVDFGRFQAAAIGSGWDASMSSHAEIVARKAAEFNAPLVVDAGALPGLAEWVRQAPLVVATPHPGEAAQLFTQLRPEESLSRSDAEEDIPGVAERLAQLSGAIVVLKAAQTAIATPEGDLWVWNAPAGWGACAGAGDVLAGVIVARLAAVVARGEASDLRSAGTAVAAAVGLHGLAAGLASGVLASDLTDAGSPGGPIVASGIAAALPNAFRACLEWAHN